MSNNNPTSPPPAQNQRPNDPKPLSNRLAPIPLRRVGRLPATTGLEPIPLHRVGRIRGVIRAPTPPNMGGKCRTRRKHKKTRKTHRRRN